MLLNQPLRFGYLLGPEAEVRGQFHRRVNPELGFTIGVPHMHVGSPLLTGEDVEPKPLHDGMARAPERLNRYLIRNRLYSTPGPAMIRPWPTKTLCCIHA